MQGFVNQAVSRGLSRVLQLEPEEQLQFINCNRPYDWADFSSRP